MAEVNRELVLSGILHGVSTAVAGGLINADEAMHADGYVGTAQDVAVQMIAGEPGEMKPNLGAVSETLHRIWEIIDRF
jgi:hypothetical protein